MQFTLDVFFFRVITGFITPPHTIAYVYGNGNYSNSQIVKVKSIRIILIIFMTYTSNKKGNLVKSQKRKSESFAFLLLLPYRLQKRLKYQRLKLKYRICIAALVSQSRNLSNCEMNAVCLIREKFTRSAHYPVSFSLSTLVLTEQNALTKVK